MTEQPLVLNPDAYSRGLDYLYHVRSLALTPDLVDLVYDPINRHPVCDWIGHHISAVNNYLRACLQACHNCFHPWDQPAVQVLAAPLAQSFGVDALCNHQTSPITILVDVGRIVPPDWLLAVVHEYAHAYVGTPGHHQPFAQALTHLCLGLGIALPPRQGSKDESLRFYPPCRSTGDPLSFWRGEVNNWEKTVPSVY